MTGRLTRESDGVQIFSYWHTTTGHPHAARLKGQKESKLDKIELSPHRAVGGNHSCRLRRWSTAKREVLFCNSPRENAFHRPFQFSRAVWLPQDRLKTDIPVFGTVGDRTVTRCRDHRHRAPVRYQPLAYVNPIAPLHDNVEQHTIVSKFVVRFAGSGSSSSSSSGMWGRKQYPFQLISVL